MTLTNTELRSLKNLLTGGKYGRVQFLAEGVRVLEESVRHRVTARRIFVCEERLTERGKTVVGRMQKLGGMAEAITTRQLEAISEAETSQGIIGLFDSPRPTFEQLDGGLGRRVLVCDGISDPGNLGTIFRSALAFGFGAVVVCGDSTDSYAPKTVRASAGAVFGIRIFETTAATFLKWARETSACLLAADKSGEPITALRATLKSSRSVCLAIGSEAKGVSTAIQNASTAMISIHHEPAVESLNAAVAGSILMKGLYDLWHSDRR